MHHTMKYLALLSVAAAAGAAVACADPEGGDRRLAPDPVSPPGVVAADNPMAIGIAHNRLLALAVDEAQQANPAMRAAMRTNPCGYAAALARREAADLAAASGVTPADIRTLVDFWVAIRPRCGGDPSRAPEFAARLHAIEARLARDGRPFGAAGGVGLATLLDQTDIEGKGRDLFDALSAAESAADGPMTGNTIVASAIASLGRASEGFWMGTTEAYGPGIATLSPSTMHSSLDWKTALEAAAADVAGCATGVSTAKELGVTDPKLLAAACVLAGGVASAKVVYQT